MEGTPIFILYCLLFAAAVVLLVLAVVKRKKIFWCIVYPLELASMLLAFALTVHFDSMPPEGIIPGFTYFAETLFSMGAVALFAGLFLISATVGIIMAILHAKKKA